MNDISKEASLSKLFSLKTFSSTVFENNSKSLILEHSGIVVITRAFLSALHNATVARFARTDETF